MKKVDIARAWTDEDYYLALTDAERAALPPNPAALMTATDQDLRSTAAGAVSAFCTSSALCSPCPPYNCY